MQHKKDSHGQARGSCGLGRGFLGRKKNLVDGKCYLCVAIVIYLQMFMNVKINSIMLKCYLCVAIVIYL
jgi:hypothetical protein